MTSSNFLAGLAFGGAAIIMGIGLLSLGESMGVKEPDREVIVQQPDVSREQIVLKEPEEAQVLPNATEIQQEIVISEEITAGESAVEQVPTSTIEIPTPPAITLEQPNSEIFEEIQVSTPTSQVDIEQDNAEFEQSIIEENTVDPVAEKIITVEQEEVNLEEIVEEEITEDQIIVEEEIIEDTPEIATVSAPYEIPVLVLKYFPQNGGYLDQAITNANYSLAFVRQKVDRITKELGEHLADGSRYHGYKDASAVPSLLYTIYEEREFLSPIPVSSQFLPFPDHFQMFQEADIDICNYVETQGIKEVWIWMYHTDNIAPIESNMAGPYGDISNSYRHADLPVCQKTYTVFEFNYTRDTAEALESYGHQLEAVFRHIDTQLFDVTYVGPVYPQYGARRCGNVHNPPNAAFEYDRQNSGFAFTDCEDWKPDGSGIRRIISCLVWDCDVAQWQVYWMQNMPGKDNNLSFEGGNMRNWWEFIGDFDGAMAKGKKFTE